MKPILFVLTAFSMTVAVPAQQAPAVFFCPEGEGLCTWTHAEGWERLPLAGLGDNLSSFLRTKNGYFVALSRGQSDQGALQVFSPDGDLLVVRSLSSGSGLSLQAAAGETPEGFPILCNGDLGECYCDILVGNTSQETWRFVLNFPADCVFPRVDSKTGLACLDLYPSVELLHQHSPTGPFSRTSLGISVKFVRDLRQPRPGLFVIHTDRELLVSEGGEMRRLSVAGAPQLLSMLGDELFAVSCIEGTEPHSGPCYVYQFSKDLQINARWRLDDGRPIALQVTPEGAFLADVWGVETRSIVRLNPPAQGEGSVEVLWNGPPL